MKADKIPATIVTGFLGSGKTTLISHLIQHAGTRKLALIVNEFGSCGIDGDLLAACSNENCGEDDIIELANGCICCTVADDFLPAMTAILARDEKPDHIIIETSGLALPKPLVQAFNWPEVATQVTADGVVAVVDAPAIAAGQFAHDHHAVDAQRAADESLDHESPLEELFEEQIACADLIIFNKSDDVTAEDWHEIEHQVEHAMRPGTGTLRANFGRVTPDVLLGLHAAAEDDLESRKSHHDDGEPHEHDDFISYVLDIPETDDQDAFLETLRATLQKYHVLRAKGRIDLAGKAMPMMVQAVGPRVQHHFVRKDPAKTGFVVIGEADMDIAGIAAALNGKVRS